MVDLLVSHKPYEKKSGVACFAPYVGVIISSLSPRLSGAEKQNPDTVVFDARIDTGADITCIPKAYASKLGPLILGNPITVRGHDGNVTRVWTYRLTISILAYPDEDRLKSYRPEKGILLTDSSIGLIGMDVIGACRRVTFDSTTKEFFIEC
ncbi:MAG: Peptidase protein [Candidatus Poribacteria bacterium]|nr:Peptidase protein [Candidatus Poribacteria bacterium]